MSECNKFTVPRIWVQSRCKGSLGESVALSSHLCTRSWNCNTRSQRGTLPLTRGRQVLVFDAKFTNNLVGTVPFQDAHDLRMFRYFLHLDVIISAASSCDSGRQCSYNNCCCWWWWWWRRRHGASICMSHWIRRASQLGYEYTLIFSAILLYSNDIFTIRMVISINVM